MASSLGLKSIAEIVETQTAAHDLEEMGCDYAQGYFYCEPVEAEQAFKVLRTWDGSIPVGRQRVATPSESTQDNSPTVVSEQAAAVLSDDTVMLPADAVAERLRRDS
jgi:hypothetical protein